MKNIFTILIYLLFMVSCSFDNKTGIWKIDEINQKKVLINPKLEDAFKKNKLLIIEKKVASGDKINLDKITSIKKWSQNHYNNYNNIPNVNYKNKKIKIFKSSRLGKTSVHSNASLIKLSEPFYYQNTIVYNDVSGTIYVYSISKNKKIFSYNFYKKKFKKIKKKLHMIIKDNIVYVADNIGYLYALDVNSSKIIWAKNFGTPFRTEIKIINNQLILSNQDNSIYSINLTNGEKNWTIDTAEQFLKSSFTNSIVHSKNSDILYLNTAGELHSINLSAGINWMLNFKQTSVDEENELFLGLPLVIRNNNLIISTNNGLDNLDANTGLKKWSKKIKLKLKPTISGNNIFLVSNNLLVCLNLETGDVIWSRSIKNDDEESINYKVLRDIKIITNLTVANNKILLFTLDGYLLSFNSRNGNILSADNISSKGFGSNPSFIGEDMYFFDKKYRLFAYK